jgi:hypothetical protein
VLTLRVVLDKLKVTQIRGYKEEKEVKTNQK